MDEFGTITAAAESLGTTQSNLSQILSRRTITIQLDRRRRRPSGHFSVLHQYSQILKHLASIEWTSRRIRDALELPVKPEAVRRWLRSKNIPANPPNRAYAGEQCHLWKGGNSKNGEERYIAIPPPSDYVGEVKANGWIFEHRIVAQRKLGRPLLPQEEVHHIDDNGKNNHPDNLMVFPNHKEHMKHHHDLARAKTEERLAELRALDRKYVQSLGW